MTANKTTQISLQTSSKRARLSRKAETRDAQRAANSCDGLTVPSDGPATFDSAHAFRPISAQSSLSDLSVPSSRSKTHKVPMDVSPQKRTRLVPRAYKRGGKNKPIIIRDSSLGELQEEIRFIRKKKSAGLNTEATSKNGPIELPSLGSGPVEVLSELRIMQTCVLQSLVNRGQNAERKKRKKAVQPKKTEATPSCSSQGLSRPPPCHNSGSAGSAVLADGLPGNPAVTPITVADVPSGALSASKTRNVLKIEAKICDVKDSAKESTRLSSDSASGREAIDSGNPEVTIKHNTTNKSEQAQDNTCLKDKDSSFEHLATIDVTPVSPKALLKPKNQINNSDSQKPKLDVTVARTHMPSVNSDSAINSGKLMMDQKELTTDSVSLTADNTRKRKRQACINDILPTKDLCYRATTPGNDRTNRLTDHLEQTAVPSSILAQSLTKLNPPFVNSATDIRILEQPLDINEPGPDSYNRTASIIHVPIVPTETCLNMQEIEQVQGTCALPTVDVEQGDDEIFERQTKYVPDDNPEHNATKVERVDALSNAREAIVIPRLWIDENRLEAQSAGQFGRPVAIKDDAVSVFDSVATVSKFLDLVTYPLRLVWRIAYRT